MPFAAAYVSRQPSPNSYILYSCRQGSFTRRVPNRPLSPKVLQMQKWERTLRDMIRSTRTDRKKRPTILSSVEDTGTDTTTHICAYTIGKLFLESFFLHYARSCPSAIQKMKRFPVFPCSWPRAQLFSLPFLPSLLLLTISFVLEL